MYFLNKIKSFLQLTRAYSLGVTFASCLPVLAFAHYSERFSIFNFALLLIALCLVHLGANLFDDYIDVKQKLKNNQNLKDIKFNSFVPKAKLILDGTYSFFDLNLILFFLFIIPLFIGIYFAFISGWQVLLFAFFGGILTLIYPISSRYYLAEIIIGLIYGPLIIMGGYFALTGEFNSGLFLLSWAIFFATLILLHTHSLMDWEFDESDGKKTLCLYLKTKRNAMRALKGMIFASYFIIIFGVLTLNLNPHTLYVFLTLPIATKLQESMNDYININNVKFTPRWYYGFFENWKEIEQKNIAFFMYRFYLARNFSFFFALFAAIGTIV